MSLNVTWGDRLELLADRFFHDLEDPPPDDPFCPECVVTGSRTAEAWLKHRFLLDRAEGFRVQANWEFRLLKEFVDDALYLMEHRGEREPRLHPYSPEILTWRIWRLLASGRFVELPPCAPLRSYLGTKPDPRRVFSLAGLLAGLLEDYQVYRAPVLDAWEKGEGSDWQAELWRKLAAENPGTRVRDFFRMARGLKRSGVAGKYRSLSVFGVSRMPPVYLDFFQVLSGLLPVKFYLFNPCREEWFGDLSSRGRELLAGRLQLQGAEEIEACLETGNPLLSSLGQASQAFLGEVLDRTGGQVEEVFPDSRPGTLLETLQETIRDRVAPGEVEEVKSEGRDPSLALGICHNPRREVEVLRDYLLKAFAELADLKPRQVQVLVSDMELYAPYLEAVFAAGAEPGREIPIAIVDRGLAGLDRAAAAFLSLLRLPEERFRASRVLDLLAAEPVREAFALSEEGVAEARAWVAEAGIRWGWDARERENSVGYPYWENSWRQGLDRLLLGYAAADSGGSPLIMPDESLILPLNRVEGEQAAAVLGALADFAGALRATLAAFARPCPLGEWAVRLEGVLGRFFSSAPGFAPGLSRLRRVLGMLSRAGEGAPEGEKVPLPAVLAFLEGSLEAPDPGDSLLRDAVVFSGLRQMRCLPRRVVCLLGLSDGKFPRRGDRPAYDLLRRQPRRGDRSPSREDRGALLEAMMSARERLYLSYVGRGAGENEILPPAPALGELRDFLGRAFRLSGGGESPGGRELLSCETLHRLQAFSPDYFRKESGLYSFSRENLEAARALESAKSSAPGEGGLFTRPLPEQALPERLDLETLCEFFRHPAAWLLKNRLRLRLGDVGDETPDDDEPFSLSPLDRYRLLEESGPGREGEAAPRRARAEGILPPGPAGDSAWRELEKEILDLAEYEFPADDVPGRLAELRGERRPAVKLEWEGTGTAVRGNLEPVGSGREPWLFFFRPAGIKPKDRIRAWLSHLLLAASGRPGKTLLAGKNKDRVEWDILEPVAEAQAAKRLEELLELMRRGLRSPLPFAPETSWEYACRERKDNSGPAAARSRWEGSSGYPGEMRDRILYQVFGPEGPLAAPEFKEVALKVYGPLLDSLRPKSGPGKPRKGKR